MTTKVSQSILQTKIKNDQKSNAQLYTQILRIDSVQKQLQKQQQLQQRIQPQQKYKNYNNSRFRINPLQFQENDYENQQQLHQYMYLKQLEKQKQLQQQLKQNCQKQNKEKQQLFQQNESDGDSPMKGFKLRLEKVANDHSDQQSSQQYDSNNSSFNADQDITNYFETNILLQKHNNNNSNISHITDDSNMISQYSHNYKEMPGDYDREKLNINNIEIKYENQARYFKCHQKICQNNNKCMCHHDSSNNNVILENNSQQQQQKQGNYSQFFYQNYKNKNESLLSTDIVEDEISVEKGQVNICDFNIQNLKNKKPIQQL